MRLRRIWAVLLVAFVGLNVWATAVGGWSGFVEYLRGLGPYGLLATADLLLALSISLWWMWGDAQRRGVSPWPYLVITLLTGSVGLLVYLALHAGRPTDGIRRRADGSVSIQASRAISASVPDVWKVIADFHRVDRFHPYVHRVDAIGSEVCAVGASRRCHVSGMSSVTEVVTEWEEGRGYRVRGSTPFDFLGEVGGRLWVEEDKGGALVSFELTLKPRWGFLGRTFGLLWFEAMAERMGPHILEGLDYHVRTGGKLTPRELASMSFAPGQAARAAPI